MHQNTPHTSFRAQHAKGGHNRNRVVALITVQRRGLSKVLDGCSIAIDSCSNSRGLVPDSVRSMKQPLAERRQAGESLELPALRRGVKTCKVRKR